MNCRPDSYFAFFCVASKTFLHLEAGSPVGDSYRVRGWQSCLQHMHTICSSAACKEGFCCRNPQLSSGWSHVRHTFLVYRAAVTRAFPMPFFCSLLHRAGLYLDSGLTIRNFIGPWNIKESAKVSHVLTFLLKGSPTDLHFPGLQVKTSGVLLDIMTGVNCCWLFLPLKKKSLFLNHLPSMSSELREPSTMKWHTSCTCFRC